MNLKHHAKALKIISVITILLLLYFSISYVFNAQNVDLSSPKEVIGGVYYYVGWIGSSLSQVFNSRGSAVAVGNVIKGNQTSEN